jgi:hypothetical protein
VLLDEPVRLQRSQEAVDGALGEPEALRELAHAEPPGTRGEGLQDSN